MSKLEEAYLLIQALTWQTENYMWEESQDQETSWDSRCRSCHKIHHAGSIEHHADCEVQALIDKAKAFLKE